MENQENYLKGIVSLEFLVESLEVVIGFLDSVGQQLEDTDLLEEKELDVLDNQIDSLEQFKNSLVNKLKKKAE